MGKSDESPRLLQQKWTRSSAAGSTTIETPAPYQGERERSDRSNGRGNRCKLDWEKGHRMDTDANEGVCSMGKYTEKGPRSSPKERNGGKKETEFRFSGRSTGPSRTKNRPK